MFRKFISVLICFLFLQVVVLADDLSDVKAFFNSYVNAANSYSSSVPDFYLKNAKIVRVVHKKDGTKKAVNFPMSAYESQLQKSSVFARMVGYKNNYENVKVVRLGKDYKVIATRYPNKDSVRVGYPFYFIVTKTQNGYKIKEESMDTPVQDFLKYAK